ncbi:Na+/H+ antiporter subunit D [Austwickia chelonae]|uniref:Na+/H+ antiporter subunit D n=1 Tax=Austwickia chelonae TaxID=100225 RepID=UPI000E22A483|nr:Na+/H+ antiporter subunit D [Austwickia chelonae]
MTLAPDSLLVPLPVVLPLVGAGLTLVSWRRDVWQRAISLAVLTAVLVTSVALVLLADQDGPLAVETGGWPAPMGIVLVVDRLSALMLVVSTTVTLGVTLYSIGQGRSADDERDGEAPMPIFYPTLMVLLAGVSTTFVSGDLFHIYVGFEMLLVASFVLLTLGGSADRVRAGVNYVFVSLLSSMFFLASIALVYAATGTVNLAHLSGRLDDLPSGTQLSLQVFLLLGFAVKAAVFPMSGWLPDSYPTAPAPVTAVFAGLLTKVGVYAIIRTQTLLFPSGRFDTVLLWAAILTMLFGILGAIAQDDIKRLLSFTLVSHIGYLLFGIAVGNSVGLSGAIFYVAHHILIQTTLFLVAGLIEWRTGTTSLNELGGLARTAPVIAVLFFLPAMNLAGIPPFSGFLGKIGLMQGGVLAETPLAYALVATSAVTSLLTLYAVARVWALAFWRRPVTELTDPADADIDPARLRLLQENMHRTVPREMIAPTTMLVALGIGLTVIAGPLYGITNRSATELQERTPYVQAVFPGGVR